MHQVLIIVRVTHQIKHLWCNNYSSKIHWQIKEWIVNYGAPFSVFRRMNFHSPSYSWGDPWEQMFKKQIIKVSHSSSSWIPHGYHSTWPCILKIYKQLTIITKCYVQLLYLTSNYGVIRHLLYLIHWMVKNQCKITKTILLIITYKYQWIFWTQ